MKICAISDIHGNLIDIPECDILCITGDIVPLDIQNKSNETRHWFTFDFAEWVKDLKCDKVIIIPGNHDLYLEECYNTDKAVKFKQDLKYVTHDKLELLIDELYEYNGITFYGTPWINQIGFAKRWAFELTEHEYDEPVDIYENIPECDILLTHDNPNYNGRLWLHCHDKYKHHFFGHWHEGRSYGHLNQYNCSILTNYYKVYNDLKIVTIEINKDKKDDED